jgi:hAT family C-terminal dimerisation region
VKKNKTFLALVFLIVRRQSALEMELLRWKSYWQRPDENKRPVNVTSDLGTHPTLTILLRIFATIPITTATAERSFSNPEVH